jgi:hypothetical protein
MKIPEKNLDNLPGCANTCKGIFVCTPLINVVTLKPQEERIYETT